MPWAKFDDQFPWNRKIRRLSDAAFRLHVTGIVACSRDLTDGKLTADDLDEFPPMRGLEKRLAELLDRGLWEEVDGGWLIHDYLDYNPSKSEVEAERAAARERQRLRRSKRAGVPMSADVTRDSRVTHAEVTRESQTPSRPVPSIPDPTRPVVAPDAVAPNAATLVGEWIDRCPERPPGRVVGQLSKEIKALLTEGIPIDTVRAGLEAWQAKALHPSTLASVVHEVRNPATARPMNRRPTTDDRVRDGMELARRLAAEEANTLQIGA